jgi:hypothetical protein
MQLWKNITVEKDEEANYEFVSESDNLDTLKLEAERLATDDGYKDCSWIKGPNKAEQYRLETPDKTLFVIRTRKD